MNEEQMTGDRQKAFLWVGHGVTDLARGDYRNAEKCLEWALEAIERLKIVQEAKDQRI